MRARGIGVEMMANLVEVSRRNGRLFVVVEVAHGLMRFAATWNLQDANLKKGRRRMKYLERTANRVDPPTRATQTACGPTKAVWKVISKPSPSIVARGPALTRGLFFG